jgi:FkbM family methyltransferase
LNKLLGDIKNNPIKTYKANNELTYISDLRSYTENYVPWTGEYEGATLDLVLPLVPKDQNVLDIGANVGYWTINLANQIKKGNKVYAFEPIPSNFSRIKEICKLNNFDSKTELYDFGLSNKAEGFDFMRNEGDVQRKASTFNARLLATTKGDIQVKKFDDIYKKAKIINVGFIKIDIEGFEIRFLEGAKEFFSKERPIIYGEFTPEDILRNNDDPQYVFEFFKDYTFFQETADHKFVKITNKEFTRDILIVPNEKLSNIEPMLSL